MKQILFVGDSPSRLNKYKNVAFIGSPSGKKLLEWINVLGVSDYRAVNRVDRTLVNEVINNMKNEGLIVALGKNAEKELVKLGVEFYSLPHPSPKNRKLNDKEFITAELLKLKEFLDDTKTVD